METRTNPRFLALVVMDFPPHHQLRGVVRRQFARKYRHRVCSSRTMAEAGTRERGVGETSTVWGRVVFTSVDSLVEDSLVWSMETVCFLGAFVWAFGLDQEAKE